MPSVAFFSGELDAKANWKERDDEGEDAVEECWGHLDEQPESAVVQLVHKQVFLVVIGLDIVMDVFQEAIDAELCS